jgi:hypothetical protein
MEVPFGQRQRLGHCPRCASRLIYTDQSVRDGADVVILSRRCPECEFREAVVVSALHAARLYLAEDRVRAGMLGLANTLRQDSMAEGLDPRTGVRPARRRGAVRRDHHRADGS